MNTNNGASQHKEGGGLRLFVVLVAMISIAMGMTIAMSDDNAADNDNYIFVEGDFAYYTEGSTNATVRECSDEGLTKTKLIIPEEVTHDGKTYKIDGIGDYAILENKTVKSIIIGDNVKGIGLLSFYGCTNLETVVMGENVETIGDFAFRNCVKLKTVVMGKSITEIQEGAFMNCKSLKNVVWPDKKLGDDGSLSGYRVNIRMMDRAFYGCPFKHVVLPESTVYIGEEAFYGNEELDTVVIPGSVETIGNKAFGDCPNIDKFAFGDFADEVEFGEHIFSYENGSNGIVDYKFKNMDGKEYTFTDTNVESGVFDDRAYDVDENGTALNVFGLLLDANGGTCDDSIVFTDENGILVEALPTPTREGYVFNGWYDGDEKVGVGSVFTENTTLTAKWTVASSSGNDSLPLLIIVILAILAIVGIAAFSRKE